MINTKTISEIAEKIAANFNPVKIILFGSYAENRAHDDSDLDLLVVMETKQPKPRRNLAIKKLLWEYHFPKDIIVKTPQEFHENMNARGTLTHSVVSSGKVLYEAR